MSTHPPPSGTASPVSPALMDSARHRAMQLRNEALDALAAALLSKLRALLQKAGLARRANTSHHAPKATPCRS